jgi:hypothetical protein
MAARSRRDRKPIYVSLVLGGRQAALTAFVSSGCATQGGRLLADLAN